MSTEKKDVYKYEWKKGGKTLGYGVTHDLERRRAEHVREEPGSEVHSLGTEASPEAAKAWGAKQISKYEKENGSLPPKNKPRF